MFYIHDLHRRYGPVVRVSPGEVDVLDQEAFKTIHRIGGGFVKDKWYSKFRVGDAEDVFSMLDPAKHARRRRLLAPLFSNSAILKNWYPVITGKIDLTITNIQAEAREAGEVDIFKWWTFMTADVISHLAFGEPFGMVAAQKVCPTQPRHVTTFPANYGTSFFLIYRKHITCKRSRTQANSASSARNCPGSGHSSTGSPSAPSKRWTPTTWYNASPKIL
jgi:cytochrome P450